VILVGEIEEVSLMPDGTDLDEIFSLIDTLLSIPRAEAAGSRSQDLRELLRPLLSAGLTRVDVAQVRRLASGRQALSLSPLAGITLVTPWCTALLELPTDLGGVV
jgi:hypothetical protein